MKSLMIITLVSGLNVQPAQYQDVQSCMAAAEEVKVQSSVKDVACIPFTAEAKISPEQKFEGMFDMFINLIARLKEIEAQDKLSRRYDDVECGLDASNSFRHCMHDDR
jgi:hypothetical protein